VLADVEHIVISHGHPDHLEPAALLWRSWLTAPRTLELHGPAAALELVEPWLPPHVVEPESDQPQRTLTLSPIARGETRRLATERGTYTLTALAANHDDRGQTELPAVTTSDIHRSSALAYLIEGPQGERVLYATDTAMLPATSVTALTDSALDVVFLDETFGTHYAHKTGHHDLRTFAEQLVELRHVNAITDATDVIAVHLSHHNPPDVATRLRTIGARAVSDRTVLDTAISRRGSVHLLVGGARSGKSHLAEELATRGEQSGRAITYVATAPKQQDDSEWDARIAAHRDRRPATWRTVETLDLVTVLDGADRDHTLLIDCLSLWVTGVLDENGAWASEQALDSAVDQLRQRGADLLAALQRTRADVLLVTNEVGQGVVPATRSGRVFRDELGRLNAAVGAIATTADLVVAGRVFALTTPFPNESAIPTPHAPTTGAQS
jgi:adenosylcobinamide kinase/adenosylcobinamide-phosphate guanylyltransferase